MAGKLYLSKSGYLLLSVPNSFVRGAFSALNEPGVELPPSLDGRLEAHISVMRPGEIEQLGGADKIDERGRDFSYSLGRIKEITPHGWPEMSKCWVVQVHSPELRKLRKTYGLPGLPNEGKYPFHVTIGVRRKGVLYENATGKTASPVLRPFHEDDDPAGDAGCKTAYNPEPAKAWVTGIASGDERAFVEYMICHNKEDCDSGELDGISDKELRRLQREWTSLDSKEKLQYHRKTAERKDPSYDPEHPEECCPHCGARLERGDDGDCNRCGKPWPKEAALGIPNRRDYGDLSRVKPGDLLDWIIQRHEAQKAGPHYDVRFGSPETGLYSWATKKELPQPGQRRALFRQPVHEYGYKDYEGPLTGYGQGVVRTHQKGKILVTGVRPDVITFSMATGRHPERFALVKPKSWKEKDWLLVNTTPTERVPYDKVHYKKIPVEQVDQYIEQMKEGDSLEAKLDGASSLIQLLRDGVELVSYRTSKETGRPIIHTERFFGGPGKMDIPPELVGTVLKGELYGVRDGRRDESDQPIALRQNDGGPAAGPVASLFGGNIRRVFRGGGGPEGATGADRLEALSPEVAGVRDNAGDKRLHPPADAEGRPHQQDTPADTDQRRGAGSSGAALKGEMYGARTNVDRERADRPALDRLDSDAVERADGSSDRPDGVHAPYRPGGFRFPGSDEVIPPQELGGILNASLAESLRKQQEQRVRLKNMAYDIQRFGKQDVDPQVMPRAERRKLIEQVLQHLPQDRFHISSAATTREEARKLWSRIKETGSTPATEGAVMWPRFGKPMKGKLVEDYDVHVTGTFPGEKRLAGRGVGGFTYALESGGPTVGRVGTGLSEELREEAHRDPQAYIDRVARIRSQGQFPSGAYRAPALIAMHESYPGTAVTKAGAEDKDQQAEISLDAANSLPQLILELPAQEDGEDSEKKPERPSPVLRIESKTVTTVKMGGRGLVLTPPAKAAGIKEDLAIAAKETDTDPTEAQIEAGNYKKGKISLHGLDVSIENPKGSTRSGTNPDGTTWSNKLTAHYGYIRRTEGADKDHVDVFIGPNPESELVVIIDQQDPGTKKFDECKCILGSTSDAEACELYLANYEDGWEGLQASTLVTMPQFKWWLEHGDTTKPVKDDMFVKKRQKAATAVFTDDEDFWNSPPNKEGRKCPGCGNLFKECEPLPDVEMCETCERFGPSKEAAHVPTVGVDFDGTITKLVEPFEPDVSKLEPRPNARKWMKRFQDMGARVIVFTTRGDKPGIKDWCHEHDVPIDYVNENPDQPPDTSGKIIADVYWDDRAVDASGALDKSGPEVEKRLGKAAQVEPIYRRALRTQLHSPKWNPQQGALSNVFTNLREVRERGRRIIEEGDAMDRLRAGFDPGFAHRQFRAVLSGRYRPKVTDPIDQLVFQRTM